MHAHADPFVKFEWAAEDDDGDVHRHSLPTVPQHCRHPGDGIFVAADATARTRRVDIREEVESERCCSTVG